MSAIRTAVVTGASTGIGRATTVALTGEGFHVRAGARRTDRLHALAAETGATAAALDVTDPASVKRFCAGIQRCDVLVCSAGGALGRDTIEQSRDSDWQTMHEVNVLGTVRMVRTLLPALRAGGAGHIVLIGSIAGHQAYAGGGGYNAAKFASAPSVTYCATNSSASLSASLRSPPAWSTPSSASDASTVMTRRPPQPTRT